MLNDPYLNKRNKLGGASFRAPGLETSRKKGETPFSALAFFWKSVAEWTGLEPATLDVTGRYSNQLNYHSARVCPERHSLTAGAACYSVYSK